VAIADEENAIVGGANLFGVGWSAGGANTHPDGLNTDAG
jgi:hypothetical protein